MQWIANPDIWTALITLTALEIVLGVDNIIFIAILAGKLPADRQQRARVMGLGLAMITRIALLFSITLIMRLTHPWFTVFGHGISGRDLVLIVGGLFLLAKSTFEIHDNLEGGHTHADSASSARAVSFGGVIVQIGLLDIVFSLDSVITAVGLVDRLAVMVAAIVIAIGVMMSLAGKISAFVEDHPTIKMLALSFLLLIGFSLVGEGFGLHIPKGYIYFAMAFSTLVELLNMRLRKILTQPVKLQGRRRPVDE